MMPLSEINIGDVFSNPMHRGFGNLSGLEWYVADKKDGMVKMQPMSYFGDTTVLKPIWKRNSDRMFSESWRVLCSEPPKKPTNTKGA